MADNILPVSPDVVTLEQVKKDFLPENFLQCNLNGKIWAIGIPDPPGDAGIVVNLDALKEAGLPQVAKFDEHGPASCLREEADKQGGRQDRTLGAFLPGIQ